MWPVHFSPISVPKFMFVFVIVIVFVFVFVFAVRLDHFCSIYPYLCHCLLITDFSQMGDIFAKPKTRQNHENAVNNMLSLPIILTLRALQQFRFLLLDYDEDNDNDIDNNDTDDNHENDALDTGCF